MFHFTLPFIGRHKPAPLPHVEIRYVAATKHENDEARLRRDTVANDLRCAVDDLTPGQRARFRAFAVTTPLTDKQREQGRANQ